MKLVRPSSLSKSALAAAAAAVFACSPVLAQAQDESTAPAAAAPAAAEHSQADPAAQQASPFAQIAEPFAGEAAQGPAVDDAIEPREANNIRGTLASATEAALTKGQLRSVVQRLTESDQARLMEFARQDDPELDGRIDQFQRDWRERYGQDFRIGDRSTVFDASMVAMTRGAHASTDAAQQPPAEQQHQEAAQPAAAVEPPTAAATGDAEAGPVGTAGAVPPASDGLQHSQTPQPAETTARDASDRVIVTLPAAHGLPAVAVPVINEGRVLDGWRIDAPDAVDGPKLRENLLTQLTVANERKDQWPADVNEAYRMVSHHVMLALLDQDARPGQAQGGAASADIPAAATGTNEADATDAPAAESQAPESPAEVPQAAESQAAESQAPTPPSEVPQAD